MILTFDVETTTFNKGSPFDERNQAVLVALNDGQGTVCLRPGDPSLGQFFDRAKCLVGFNLKFDLHWLRRIGIDFTGRQVFCVQLASFILDGQRSRFPSLNQVSERYLNKQKIDKVQEYWDQGIQTTDIPLDVLIEYAAKDVDLTRELYDHFQQIIPQHQRRLINLANQDLLVLEDMEWQGLKFDREKSLLKAQELQVQVDQIKAKYNNHLSCFNWNSPEHISALLYGGSITDVVRVPDGFYKSGLKAGQVKYKKQTIEYNLPRQFTPVKGSETEKEGRWSTDESYLRLLPRGGELIEDILKIKALNKEIDTYLLGLPKKQDVGFYGQEKIHGAFNQCVTATGRLSSSNPNLQNLSDEALKCFVSRYE
jgi:DNA polymerase I